MSAGGEDTVEPCLLVFMAGGCESGAGELFGVEPVGRFLRRVCADWESAFYCFAPGLVSVLVIWSW